MIKGRTAKFMSLILISLLVQLHCSDEKMNGIRLPPIQPVYAEKDITFDDIFKTIKNIKLETTDSSIIGRISQVRFDKTNGELYVLDNTYAKMLYVFNAAGGFLRHIGYKGDGPGGPYTPLSFDILQDKVIVAAYNPLKILLFKKNGDYVRNFSLSNYHYKQKLLQIFPEKLHLYKNKIYLQSMSSLTGDRFVGKGKGLEHFPLSLHELTSKGDLVRSFANFDSKGVYKFAPIYDSVSAIDKYNGLLYLAFPLELKICQYDTTGNLLNTWTFNQRGRTYLSKLRNIQEKKDYNSTLNQIEHFIFLHSFKNFLIACAAFYPAGGGLRFIVFEPRKQKLWIDFYYRSQSKQFTAATKVVGGFNNGLILSESNYETEELTGEVRNPNVLLLELNNELIFDKNEVN